MKNIISLKKKIKNPEIGWGIFFFLKVEGSGENGLKIYSYDQILQTKRNFLKDS